MKDGPTRNITSTLIILTPPSCCLISLRASLCSYASLWSIFESSVNT